MLLAFFSKLRVYDGPEGLRVESERTEINDPLHAWQAQQRHAAADHVADKSKRASRISAEGSLSSTSTGLNESNGLSNSIMVGLTGFEPATP
ncbi:hypothetical protein AAEP80_09595 [Curtobacterium sp. L3-7]|uniref:hypothetical protein n=1 Tax=Curtobacterium sp. L3-7 TaxID=3138787 RepID=UPI003B5198E1